MCKPYAKGGRWCIFRASVAHSLDLVKARIPANGATLDVHSHGYLAPFNWMNAAETIQLATA
ncbi:hypothetical protein EJB05_44637, partial [Eragrostis curvula]